MKIGNTIHFRLFNKVLCTAIILDKKKGSEINLDEDKFWANVSWGPVLVNIISSKIKDDIKDDMFCLLLEGDTKGWRSESSLRQLIDNAQNRG